MSRRPVSWVARPPAAHLARAGSHAGRDEYMITATPNRATEASLVDQRTGDNRAFWAGGNQWAGS